MPNSSILQLIRPHLDRRGAATSISAPGRPSLTYQALGRQIAETVDALRAAGLGREDRIALALPNGPEVATAFLATSSIATTVPLDPGASVVDIESTFAELGVTALLVEADATTVARAVAEQRGARVFELATADDAPAGTFRLNGRRSGGAAGQEMSGDDVALVLQTSGTTSKPKRVPLSHRNVCCMLGNQIRLMELGEEDRSLNVLPLFHFHGLVAAVLAPLAAGGEVCCAPGFDPGRFFSWLDECRPTWFTAVPAVHRALVAQAPSHRAAIDRARLRFVRSASSELSQSLATQLEKTFGAPAVDVYGMTETGPITSMPLPPRLRKRGSVGVSAGLEIAVVDGHGGHVPPGTAGEVVVRGSTVMRGYWDPAADEAAFRDGWFRTGDFGHLDADGYLFLVGRVKELINRGGEKIAPAEIEEVLLAHAGIADAAAFPVTHRSLGEEVGAVVVPREGAMLTPAVVREFAAARLAFAKVPKVVTFCDQLPRSATGKIQRLKLAERHRATFEAAARPREPGADPRTPVESVLARVWTDVLTVPAVGRDDDFLELGGDSLLGTQIAARVWDAFSVIITFGDVLQARTVAALAETVERRQSMPQP